MTTKLKLLIGLNGLFIALIALSVSIQPGSSTLSVSTNAFAVTDTASVNKINLGNLSFSKEAEGKWLINQQFQASPQRIETLLALLNLVEVKRNLPISQQDSLQKNLPSIGLPVEIFENDRLTKSYFLGGNEEDTHALMEGEEAVLLTIPGYVINFYALLSGDLSSWRDRRVLQTSWRTLKRLRVEYPTEPQNNFRIDFDSSFYKVSGISTLDTASLYQYISQFERFQVQEYLPEPATLPFEPASVAPFGKIRIEDIYTSHNNTLSIYPTETLVYAYSEKDAQWVTIDPRAIQNMFIRKEFFTVKAQKNN